MLKQKVVEVLIVLLIAAILITQAPGIATGAVSDTQGAPRTTQVETADQAGDELPAEVTSQEATAGEANKGLPEGVINLGGVKCGGGSMSKVAC